MWRLVIASILLLLLSTNIFAVDAYPFADAQRYQLFQSLISDFRCLVCQNEDLASSSASLAADLRKEVYMLVKQGQSRQQIIRYMVERYGDFVLFKPPFVAKTYVLWFAPFIFLVCGFLVWYFFILRRT